MAVKTFNTRVKNKIDKASSLSTFVPLKGELVVGGPAVSGNLANNTFGDPYVAKIGDGATQWQNLPSIAYTPLKGYTDMTVTNLGSGIFIVSVPISSDERKYVYEEVNGQNNVDTISIDLSSSNPYLGEHYVLLKNVGNSDIWFDGITADFGNNVIVHINTRQDYIVAGDICEVQIKIFKIGSEFYITAIPQLGINQSVTSSNGENTWFVNRYIATE